jgi:hypothetical protein
MMMMMKGTECTTVLDSVKLEAKLGILHEASCVPVLWVYGAESALQLATSHDGIASCQQCHAMLDRMASSMQMTMTVIN